MTLTSTFKLDQGREKLNQCARYLDRRSFWKLSSGCRHTHTTDQLLYLDH